VEPVLALLELVVVLVALVVPDLYMVQMQLVVLVLMELYRLELVFGLVLGLLSFFPFQRIYPLCMKVGVHLVQQILVLWVVVGIRLEVVKLVVVGLEIH
jgi:hypothetical protein